MPSGEGFGIPVFHGIRGGGDPASDHAVRAGPFEDVEGNGVLERHGCSEEREHGGGDEQRGQRSHENADKHGQRETVDHGAAEHEQREGRRKRGARRQQGAAHGFPERFLNDFGQRAGRIGVLPPQGFADAVINDDGVVE